MDKSSLVNGIVILIWRLNTLTLRTKGDEKMPYFTIITTSRTYTIYAEDEKEAKAKAIQNLRVGAKEQIRDIVRCGKEEF